MGSKPQSVIGDMIKQTGTHCHAPIHPPAPAPTPMAHPGIPMALTFVPTACMTVMVGNMPAVTKTTLTLSGPMPCTAACLPLGVGMVKSGSGTVKMESKDAARVNDPTDHPSCKGPIPDASGGKIMGPGCMTVMTGD